MAIWNIIGNPFGKLAAILNFGSKIYWSVQPYYRYTVMLNMYIKEMTNKIVNIVIKFLRKYLFMPPIMAAILDSIWYLCYLFVWPLFH